MSRCQVRVHQGVLEGQVLTTSSGYVYKSFSGIPYAKPPVGELRFKEPVPLENWDGVYDATKISKICSQYDMLFKKVYIGEEDCLYLNVYIPESAQPGDGLPVMFWVHGGAYCHGSGNPEVYGPEYLVQRKVIVVTINYRVGALGFLCLDIPEAPGNVGLRDQALALKWVSENIYAFGGDAQNVTIFGESAGGSSTHHLILSPVTEGLYSKAIIQSGTALCPWAIQNDYENIAFKFGKLLGMETNDKVELVKFLRTVPIERLVLAAFSPNLSNRGAPAFAPIIEKEIPNIVPFISEDPRMQMEKNDFPKIPIMAGYTSHEGFYVLQSKAESFAKQNKELTLSNLIPDFRALVPKHLSNKISEEQVEMIGNKIKNFYFPTDDNYREKYMEFGRDYAFVKDTDFIIRMYSKFMPTYYYKFSYQGSLSVFRQLTSIPYKGASHTDELPYLFHVKYETLINKPDVTPTDQDRLTIKRMTKLWANFAKYGNPTPMTTQILTTKWEPVGENGKELNCLNIGETLTLEKNPFEEAINFWNSLDDLA